MSIEKFEPVSLELLYSVLLDFRNQVGTMLDAMADRLERIENLICDKKTTLPTKFPLKTTHELHDFIQSLSDNGTRSRTASYFTSIRPTTKELVVRNFRSHFGDKLLKDFNWRGEQGKLSFKDNELFCLVADTWTSSEIDLKELQTIFKEELKKCRARIKSLKSRKQKKSKLQIVKVEYV